MPRHSTAGQAETSRSSETSETTGENRGTTVDYMNAGAEDKKMKIKSLRIQKERFYLDARGETRKISIFGTKGAGFSIVINDSSECDILEEKLDNVEIPQSGVYTINQKFPSILNTSTDNVIKETYDIIITPNADVDIDFDAGIRTGIPSYTFQQYGDTTITITPVTTQTGPAISVTRAAGPVIVTRKNKAGIKGDSIQNHVSEIYAITCAEDSATSGYFYVNDANFNKNLSTSSMIKKVVDRGDEVGYTKQLVLNPKTTRTRTVNNKSVISSDIEVGMNISYSIEKAKTVTKSLDVADCQEKTNRFQLNNTDDLFPDMILSIRGHVPVSITSVDCDREITVSKKIIIKENTDVAFDYKDGSTVAEIVSQNNSKGQACVNLMNAIKVPNNTELQFDDNDSVISGNTNFSGSGSDSVSIKSFINFAKYGTSSVNYDLNLDNMISRIPNAYDQYIVFSKYDGSVTIDMTKYDYDDNAKLKSVTINGDASHGTAVARNGGLDEVWSAKPTVLYTPVNGFTGQDEFKFTVGDGVNTSVEKTIRITIK
tara:strand:- start:542 stop:2170 length:1629 start_codon:yes stop_codon:yes gene_type:complete